MTNGLFGACFGHFNMFHHLNLQKYLLTKRQTYQFKTHEEKVDYSIVKSQDQYQQVSINLAHKLH